MDCNPKDEIVVNLRLDAESARLIQHAIHAQKALAKKDIRRGFQPNPDRLNMKHKSLTVGQAIIDEIDAQFPRRSRQAL